MGTHVVIMAGGIGSRFWPMSTQEYPKQFIDVVGCGKSLLQLTVERFSTFCSMTNFWVVTSEKYVEIVKKQLPELSTDNILAEPLSRNTAPCIAYACWKIKKRHPQANIVVTPSDALVINIAEFQRVISSALEFTASNNSIVTIGIKPNRPETGYGYICATEKVGNTGLYSVEGFKEKPDLKTAQRYLQLGNYFWNAGIFVWNVNTIDESIRQYTPDLSKIMDEMSIDFFTEAEKITVSKQFPKCDKISIDYAVMEKAEKIYTLPAEFGWSDLGSWGALRMLLPQDEDSNACIGEDVRMYNCRNCIVHTQEERRVVVEGLDGYIIAENKGALLVCSLKEEQRIKEFVN
jgi:mannose-1-phosphate guanylyltransferase